MDHISPENGAARRQFSKIIAAYNNSKFIQLRDSPKPLCKDVDFALLWNVANGVPPESKICFFGERNTVYSDN